MQKPPQNRRKLTEAFGYMRTSSAANIGRDKDSEARQRRAIAGYAKAAGYVIAADDWFYDPAVRGSDQITDRPGFKRMLDRIAANGVRVILIESPDRFARDLAVQLAGHDYLKNLGVTLIPATAPDFFIEDTPTAVLVRQVLGAIAQFDKATLISKLRGARQRRREIAGKCEGRKTWREICEAPGSPYAATPTRPSLIDAAKTLRGSKRNRAPLRTVAAKLAALGFANTKGRPFSPASVKAMLQA